MNSEIGSGEATCEAEVTTGGFEDNTQFEQASFAGVGRFVVDQVLLDAYYLKDRFGSVNKLRTEVKGAVVNSYGYLLTAAGAVAIAAEQSPANEKFRIQEGLETLAETGDPSAVERTVQIITLPIEIVPVLLVALAVHANNHIAVKGREALHAWRQGGEERAKFRETIKEQEVQSKMKVENDKRLSENKFARVKRAKAEKKEDRAQTKKVKEHWRVLNGKKPHKKEEEYGRMRSGITAGGRLIKDQTVDAFVALGLGAGIVVFKKAMEDRSRRPLQTILSGLKATAIISLVSGRIGYYLAAGTESAKWEVPGTNHTVHYEQQAQWLVDYGTDTKALMAILLAAYTPSTLYKLYHRLPSKEAEFQKWKESQEVVA